MSTISRDLNNVDNTIYMRFFIQEASEYSCVNPSQEVINIQYIHCSILVNILSRFLTIIKLICVVCFLTK